MVIEKLYYGDMHAEALFQALWTVIEERAQEMPIPTVIGVIELLKDKVKEHAE